MNDCIWKYGLAANSSKTISNSICLKILVTLGPFTHSFNLKLKPLSCKKMLKFVLRGNCYFDLFAEVEIWY